MFYANGAASENMDTTQLLLFLCLSHKKKAAASDAYSSMQQSAHVENTEYKKAIAVFPIRNCQRRKVV